MGNEEIEFGGAGGAQLFVTANDAEGVLSAIEDYVATYGCGAVVDPETDDDGQLTRTERRFALAAPEGGIVTVWEDGMWADRRLARELSQKLGTTVVWLLVAPTTDAWAVAKYVNGDEVEREFEETDEFRQRADAVAKRERLPHAFRYFEDPGIGRLAANLDIPILKELGIDLSATGSGADEEAAGLLTRTFPCGGESSG